ncbi:thiol-disulfide oxidoreductase DCC family protein [Paenibacillus hodogayensis]|uniref:Thiol-disulfide oxidoreductase DCC family protein n=1 Tax=Paenibacillus hodogayensis TaxID=279208 RepID=A0ABV5VSB1_9BACL
MKGQGDTGSIILFDGECNLCHAVVRFVISRDPKRRFRFAALDSEAGLALRGSNGIRPSGPAAVPPTGGMTAGKASSAEERSPRTAGAGKAQDAAAESEDGGDPGTFMLLRSGKLYTKSRAALEVFRLLRGLWPLLYVFVAVPAAIRDPVYDFIARRRYGWFGRSDHCLVPGPEERDRFIG